MGRAIAPTLLAVLLVSSFAWSAQETPVAVSPGSGGDVELVASACTTFSWTITDDTRGFTLAINEVTDDGQLGQPVIRQALPAGASAWTLPAGRCLSRGSTYAWAIGISREDEGRRWSKPVLFRVAPEPTAAELREALAVVRSYLESNLDSAEEVAGNQFEAARENDRLQALGRSADAAPATTYLTVDGNVDAVSFSGDGSALTSLDPTTLTDGTAGIDISGTAAMASDLACTDCVSGPELEFDPATQTELDSHVVANPTAHHVPPTSLPPSGSAGGDLAGSYPSPAVVDDSHAHGDTSIGSEIARDSEVLTVVQCIAQSGMRYLDLGDGTVLDCNQKLIWLKDASCENLDGDGFAHWDDAQAAAAALSNGTCGLTDDSIAGDWRLPTVAELCSAWSGSTLSPCPAEAAGDSLVNSSFSDPTVVNTRGDAQWLEGDTFIDVESWWYWSSVESSSTSAWAASLSTGAILAGTKDGNNFRMWPVRRHQ
jgi:hypothetical protein